VTDCCGSCGHESQYHCDHIGRCNVMVHTPKLTLAECNCPAYAEYVQYDTEEKL
jgi:hypothetical protein